VRSSPRRPPSRARRAALSPSIALGNGGTITAVATRSGAARLARRSDVPTDVRKLTSVRPRATGC
jgi:hypothetical protein